MGHNIYPPRYLHKTATVAEIRDLLANLPGGLPVAFKSPSHGAFGPGSIYTIDSVSRVLLPGEEPFEDKWEGVVLE